MISGDGSEGDFIVGIDHYARIIDSRPVHFFDYHAEDGFLFTITVDNCLKGQTPLPFTGCRNDRLSDLHSVFLLMRET